MKVFLLPVGLWALLGSAAGISFEVPHHRHTCLQEDIHKDVLVVGEYTITEDLAAPINLEISDSRGHPVYKKDSATAGKFAFTSDDYDTFSICFNSAAPNDVAEGSRTVTLTVKAGVEARSYDAIAKAEKLKPMELELRRLEDLSQSVVHHFALMKKREEEHRDTNESTNDRMLHFSIFSMVCLLGLAVWQVMYLKRFFQQKKLI